MLAHLRVLSDDSYGGRRIGSDGNKLAQNYLVSTLKAFNVLPFQGNYQHSFEQRKIFQTRRGTNVIGLIEGRKYKQQYIVLTAHFDHIGNKGSQVYNGADDNASGTAALLNFAEKISQAPLNYSVIFLFTDGEEANLSGATAFVKNNDSLMKNVKLNINLDMIAGNHQTKTLRYISDGLEQLLVPEHLVELVHLQERFELPIKKGFKQSERGYGLNRKTKWELASDHGVFYRLKIPFIYYGVGTHSNYHETTDTYQNVNLGFFVKATGAIFKQLLYIDKHI
ncbi:M28 family peptidase [Colwelliaceae bacterium 6471]